MSSPVMASSRIPVKARRRKLARRLRGEDAQVHRKQRHQCDAGPERASNEGQARTHSAARQLFGEAAHHQPEVVIAQRHRLPGLEERTLRRNSGGGNRVYEGGAHRVIERAGGIVQAIADLQINQREETDGEPDREDAGDLEMERAAPGSARRSAAHKNRQCD